MKIALLLLVSLSLDAQTANIQVGGKTQTFATPPAITVTSLACNNPDGTPSQPGAVITILPGQTSTCEATISAPAPSGGFAVTPFTADSPLILGSASLVVPESSISVKFTVSRGIAAP